MGEFLVWILAPVCWAFACTIVIVTLLPLSNANVWWVRVMDFPRVQIAIIGGLVLIAALFVPGVTRVTVPVLMIAACRYQLWRIYPYTPFAPIEMQLADTGPDAIKVLSSNVLMENDRHDLLLEVIEEFDLDIL